MLNRFIDTSPFQQQITTARARSVWRKTMPKTVCDRTEKLYVYNNKIFLKINSAALRHDFQFNKDKILALLQESMPKTLLQDVIFL
ncbi:DciA family protein [Cardinium endosymbiont of Tipula unca]|uniref:DciA family protein n=1 Tax=Cardinium endosymbiont of Tipula unca TaxID=3066216 RepID=UPI0030CAAE1E